MISEFRFLISDLKNFYFLNPKLIDTSKLNYLLNIGDDKRINPK